MRKVLIVEPSIMGAKSNSRKIADYIVENFGSMASITRMDLTKHDLGKQIDELSPEKSLELVKEVLEYDQIILMSPLYNFTVPSRLKCFMDHLAKLNLTFKYSKEGSVVPLATKNNYSVITVRGGMYKADICDGCFDYNLIQQVFSNFFGMKENHKPLFAEGVSIKDASGTLVNPISKWNEVNKKALEAMVTK